MTTRYLLVMLDLDDTVLQNVAFQALKGVLGVTQVTDLAVVSQATLDLMLLKPSAALERADPSAFNAIRRHHQHQQQPTLPLQELA